MCKKSDRINISGTSLSESRPATEEVTETSLPPLRPGECWLLDAPGITKSTDRLRKHIEGGGRILHRVRLNNDGEVVLVDE